MHASSAKINVRLLVCASLAGALALCGVANAQSTDTTQDTVQDTTPGTGTTLSTNGIFGCRGQGAQIANVGTTRAIGGVYVPVNDAAVTLNTGYLVYKECVLDGMARSIAQNASAEATIQQYRSVMQQMNTQGGPLTNYDAFLQPYNDQILSNQARAIQNSPMCGAFRGRVATALVRSLYTTRNSNAAQACSMSDAQRAAMINGTAPVNFSTIVDFATDNEFQRLEQELANTLSRQARLEQNMRDMVMMGRGMIPIFEPNQDPLAMRVVTPGFLIADAISQASGSGFRQLENANEIDQIVSNLWAGLTTQLVTSGGGIPGLFTGVGSTAGYIDRMVSATQASVRAGAANAAVAVLAGARQAEAAYLTAKQGIATALLGSADQLRSIENQCWGLIIPAVQTYAQTNGNPTLNIATSTQFSQPLIDAQIASAATTTSADILASQQALARLDQLIADVTNSASSAAQQQALVQLDQMVANNQLHTQQDAQNAATQRDSVTSVLTTLVNDTKVAWADSTDANVGWCNVNNTATVQRWFDAWRQ